MDNILNISLSEREYFCIKKCLEGVQYDPTGSLAYISELRFLIYKFFPKRILNIFEKQRSTFNPEPYIIINNIPIDTDIFGSPKFNQTGSQFKSGTLSENVICAFGLLAGEPYSVYFEGRELVNNLVPEAEYKYDYTGLGSEVELDFHIENAALRFISEDDCSPQAIFLLGIRHDPFGYNPKTILADARCALKNIASENIDELYKDNFEVKVPYRWRDTYSKFNKEKVICSILSGSIDIPRVSVAFYADMVQPLTEKAKRAYNEFYHAIKLASHSLTITPGAMVYIDNRFALHAREKFEPAYDLNGNAYRWVQRLFIKESLWNFRNIFFQNGRVFKPLNSSNNFRLEGVS